MTAAVDLHTHSTASDGQYSPAALVRLAKERGIETLALTDHDTLDGLDEAVLAGDQIGVQVLRGVELGAREYRGLHILGYCISPEAPGLRELCDEMKRGRNERKYRIIEFLRAKGVDLSLEEVEELAGGGIIGRPHFAQVMVRRGYVKTPGEAFGRYLDTDEYQRIERQKPDARICVEAIRSAGGKVSLAHPYQTGLEGSALDGLVRKLAGYGLDAIECWYPRHTQQQREFYLSLAQKYELHVTGGSDFHGEKVKPDIQLARYPLDISWM